MTYERPVPFSVPFLPHFVCNLVLAARDLLVDLQQQILHRLHPQHLAIALNGKLQFPHDMAAAQTVPLFLIVIIGAVSVPVRDPAKTRQHPHPNVRILPTAPVCIPDLFSDDLLDLYLSTVVPALRVVPQLVRDNMVRVTLGVDRHGLCVLAGPSQHPPVRRFTTVHVLARRFGRVAAVLRQLIPKFFVLLAKTVVLCMQLPVKRYEQLHQYPALRVQIR